MVAPISPRVLLLRPPQVFPRWAHVSTICPPLGLAYVAASVQEAGFGVECLDAVGEAPFQQIVLENPNFISFGLSVPQILERVQGSNCDVLGVSLMFSHDWPVTKAIIQAIRRVRPNLCIVAGGEHITALPQFCLEDCPELDICVMGEGEATLVDLLAALRDGRDLATVKGIAYRAASSIARTPTRARIRKLEEIPWPAWDLFPLETYLANGLGYGVNPGRSVPLLASRGCPFECTFCSNPDMWTTRWAARPVADVIEEMAYYIEHYGAHNFDFYDLTTIVRKDWIIEFCQELVRRAWKITWQMPAGTRSEALDAEVLTWLTKSGQRNIVYAPESGSAHTLKMIKKKIHLDRMKDSIRAAVAERMNIKLNMIMGFPHETRREVFESYRFLAEVAWLGVDDVYIACFSPYPGSELFEQLRAAGEIPALDTDYFLKLTSISDLTSSRSYAPRLPDRMLTVYRLFGMALFYAISYLTHPLRPFRTLLNVLRGREESRLEMSLLDMRDRLLPGKRVDTAAPAVVPASRPAPPRRALTKPDWLRPAVATVLLGTLSGAALDGTSDDDTKQRSRTSTSVAAPDVEHDA